MGDAASPTPSIEVVADAKWTDGDFEIISSDNISFRIQSYHLLSNRLATATGNGS
jgi:hypothetical protein